MKELDQQEVKINKLKEDGADEHDLNKQVREPIISALHLRL